MKECIRVENITKRYGRKVVVNSINFSVMKGHICAFLGPNGAGKSTTMNMLSTLLVPTKGKIYINEFDMSSQRDFIKSSIGVVFQEDVLDNELTIYENLYYRGGLYYQDRKQLHKRMGEVEELLSLSELGPKKYGTCSGGQRRLAQIGRALMSNPTLLLLDEPTIGLDPIARAQVWSVLKKLNQSSHMTIFFTTHYMEEAEWADHICMINKGNILLCSEKSEVLKPKGMGGSLSIQEVYIKALEEDLH